MNKNESKNLEQFILINKIGSGSFGKVYKAKDKKTGEILAAKISILPLTFNDEDNSQYFNLVREVNIISKLNHPSVLRFIYFSRNDFKNKPKPIIITEYASNGSLEDFISLSRQSICDEKFDDTRKLIIIYGIASGMSYLHSHNIIHRDLKPANILLDDFLCPKIADFGLSKIDSNKKDTYVSKAGIKGTPCYMSPEIWIRNEYSKSSDVYAYGIILYELFTNDMPFEGMMFYNIYLKLKEGYRPEFKSPIPDSYRKLIEKCWAQEPSERPTFDEIVEELQNERGFITDLIEENDYLNYIDFIKESKITFEANQQNINIDEFTHYKNKRFQRISLDPKPKKSILTNEVSPSAIFPIEEFINLEEECKIMLKDAESDPMKQFAVAQNLIHGLNNFPFKISLGIKYLIKSANNGCDEAALYYIKMLIKGKIIPQELDEAKKYLENRISKKEAKYFLLNGLIHKKEKKYEIAIKNFEEGMKKDDSESFYEYGKMLLNGEGIPIDKEKANKYFELASEKGNLNAMFKCALERILTNKEESTRLIKKAADEGHTKSMLYYSNVLKEENNKEESINYVKLAAEKGNINGMYEYGLILKEDKNYEESLFYLKKAADRGHIEAKYLYGCMLKKGLGVTSNSKEGSKYIKSAADKGSSRAMNHYGIILANGDGVAADYNEAQRYLKNAIKKGNIDAMSNYGQMLLLGLGIPADYSEACKYFKLAADQGQVDAMLSYANCLDNGIGVPVNNSESFRYFKMAAEHGDNEGMYRYAINLLSQNINDEGIHYMKLSADKGNVKAMYFYAKMLYFGKDVASDVKEAARLFKMSADNGNVESAKFYASILYNDFGAPADFEEGARYSQIAAEKGDPDGMYQYGLILLEGKGIPIDKKAALMYIKKAANKGHVEAMNKIGILLEDKQEALNYLKKASDEGNIESMFHYARILLLIENSDKQEIVKYFKMAADGGLDEAMAMYGHILDEGIVVPVDKENAIRYFKMAIAKGNNTAMFFYGQMLQKGNGCKMDKEEAVKFYKMAMEKGEMNAQFNYAMMLKSGDGIPIDLEEAARLMKIAADRNHIKSIIEYAKMLESGIGVISNKDEARDYFHKGSLLGSKEATQNYMRLQYQSLNQNDIKGLNQNLLNRLADLLDINRIDEFFI